jgi:hypothetical protein
MRTSDGGVRQNLHTILTFDAMQKLAPIFSAKRLFFMLRVKSERLLSKIAKLCQAGRILGPLCSKATSTAVALRNRTAL